MDGGEEVLKTLFIGKYLLSGIFQDLQREGVLSYIVKELR